MTHAFLVALARRVFPAILLALPFSLACAQDSQTGKSMSITIEPQPLTTALQIFSEQSGLQVGFASALAESLVTRGVRDAKSAVEALDALLAGTDLDYRFVNDNTVVIRAVDAGDDKPRTTTEASGRPLVLAQAPMENQGGPTVARPEVGDSGEPGEGGQASAAAGLYEIVVTARRREEDLQQVPMAVAAFNAEQLEAAQITNIADLERMTPNVTISDTGGLVAGAVSVFMRGIGNDPGFDQGIGIYVDDVYLNRTTGALLETYDVERIEVLKGPQGHLYGRNTIGGAIKYVTRRPGDELRAEMQAKAGEFDLRQLKGSMSGPLIEDRLYGGFGFMVKQQDGIQTNSVDGREFWDSDFQGYRASLFAKLSDTLTANLSLDYVKDNSAPRLPNRVAVNSTASSWTGTNFLITGANLFFGPGAGLFSTPNDASLPTDIDRVSTDFGAEFDRFEIETKTAALTLEWDINDRWMLKSVSAARWGNSVQPYDFDASPQFFITNIQSRDSEDFSQELQFNYGGEKLNAVIGLYYLDATQDTRAYNPQSPRLRGIQTYTRTTLDNEETLESSSAYASIDWNFAEQWQLSFGGRYTRDEKAAYLLEQIDEQFFALARLTGVPNLPPTAVVAIAPGREAAVEASPLFGGWANPLQPRAIQRHTINEQRGGLKWSEFTPSARLRWSVAEDTMLYAGYATGFKAGAFYMANNTLDSADPETVDSYTLGLKMTLGGNFRLNAEAFYSDYQDKQINTIIVQPDNSLLAQWVNVGEMTTSGAEVEMSWTPLADLLLGLNLGYLDTDVKTYLRAGVNIADQTAIGFSPELTAQARVQYGFAIGEMGRLTLGADVAYRDESYTNSPVLVTDSLEALQVQEAHEIWNAAVSWRSPGEKWRVALEGRNLGDERVLTNTYRVGNFVTGAYTMPRTWAFSVRYVHR